MKFFCTPLPNFQFRVFPLSLPIPCHNHRGPIIITRNRIHISGRRRMHSRSRGTMAACIGPQKAFSRGIERQRARHRFGTFLLFRLDLLSPPFSCIFPHDSRLRAWPLLVSLGYIEAPLNCRRFSMGAVWTNRENSPGKTCLYSRPCGNCKRRKNRESLSRLQPPR